jgi:inner membrane protein
VPTESTDVRAVANGHGLGLHHVRSSSRRPNPLSLTLGLVGLVFGLDLLWSRIGVSSGSLAYALADVPGHLATCAIALVAFVRVVDSWPPVRSATAALVACIAIDVDHIPGYLGSHLLAGTLPRPYGHSVLWVAALVTLGLAARRRDVREISLGIAFGLSAHLLRDLATGPGVPLVWPISGAVVTLPYAVFAAVLALAALTVAVAGRFAPARGLSGLAAVPVSAPRKRPRRRVTQSFSDSRKR